MARVMMDCRQLPSDINCSLVISGERDEVVRAAVLHAEDVHGEEDTPELRDMIERGLVPEPPPKSTADVSKEVRI